MCDAGPRCPPKAKNPGNHNQFLVLFLRLHNLRCLTAELRTFASLIGKRDQISEKSSLPRFNSKMNGLSGPTQRNSPSPASLPELKRLTLSMGFTNHVSIIFDC